MLPLLLLRLRSLGWRRPLGAAAAGGIIALALLCWRQRQELQRLRLVYENPRTVEVVREVRVQGPERVVTRVIRDPGGRVETVREETRGPVVTTRDGAKTSEPVFPPAPRLDRWLLGAGVEPFHWGEKGAAALHAGYSFRNRLDLCAGITHDRKAEILFTVRF
jgi:hypothetical protein